MPFSLANRENCANPRCREDLVPTPAGFRRGYAPARLLHRTGRWFCPSCRYIGKRAFAIGLGLAGLVFGLAKVWAKL
ncbi:MAG TPA: hypothetical protein VE135_10295 [Pyrinomonadaceae bacterium]|nr:hypothetical protein [Pyrinomonadaceae bacterium]